MECLRLIEFWLYMSTKVFRELIRRTATTTSEAFHVTCLEIDREILILDLNVMDHIKRV